MCCAIGEKTVAPLEGKRPRGPRHSAGGTTLTMPKPAYSSARADTYDEKSSNSAHVGRSVGASGIAISVKAGATRRRVSR